LPQAQAKVVEVGPVAQPKAAAVPEPKEVTKPKPVAVPAPKVTVAKPKVVKPAPKPAAATTGQTPAARDVGKEADQWNACRGRSEPAPLACHPWGPSVIPSGIQHACR
jgi:hypothetical protein